MKRATLGLFACCLSYWQSPDPTITFEVASVKASPPRTTSDRSLPLGCTGGPGTSSPGLFRCTNATALSLVRQAFDLKSYQLPSGNSAGTFFTFQAGSSSPLPAGFEIMAKIPAGATKEQFRTMLRNLLIDRLKLTYHYEKKDSQVYDLVVAKDGLKLKASPPDSSPAADGAESAPLPPPGRPAIDANGCPVYAVRRGTSSTMGLGPLTCVMASNLPIDEIATVLSGQLGRPVTDATGLKGRYDFTLGYSMGSLGARPGGGSTSIDGGAPDTDGGPTLLAAIQKQLGLKLEQKKGAIEIFVIDHVEKIPTED